MQRVGEEENNES